MAFIGPCPLGPALCAAVVLAFYQMVFGQMPPPYTLPPGFFEAAPPCLIVIACGPLGPGPIVPVIPIVPIGIRM